MSTRFFEKYWLLNDNYLKNDFQFIYFGLIVIYFHCDHTIFDMNDQRNNLKRTVENYKGIIQKYKLM